MLIDTHAHLNDEKYSKEERDRIIKNLNEDNIEKVITVSYDEESCYKNVEISSQNVNVYSAVGIHPSNAIDDISFLETLAKNEKVVAIGEIGLDYHYDNFDREKQIECFKKQIMLAYNLKLPVIIHLRDAYEDMLEILKEYKDYLCYGAVVHCYSGSLEYSKELLKLNLYLSFTGVITFKNARKTLEVISSMPIDRLMIETDCPYLCPEPFRGKINEPKYVNFVLDKICEIRNIEREELIKILRENVRKFFKI